MADRDGWAAAQKLVTDIAYSVKEQDGLRILEDFCELIPFNRCLVWWWEVMPGQLTDSQDLHHFLVTPDGQAGLQIESVRNPGQKALDTDCLFGAYSIFLSEAVGERSDAPVFRAYSGEEVVKGFCYKPDGQGGYSALVTKLDSDAPVNEPERLRLFECNLPVLNALFERWLAGEKYGGHGSQEFALTPRQRGILSLLVEGKSTARMAQSLCVSERTVSWHLHNIYRKLEVRSRQEAIVAVQRLDLHKTKSRFRDLKNK